MAKKKQKSQKKSPKDSAKKSPTSTQKGSGKKSPPKTQAERVTSDQALRKRLEKAVRAAEEAAERAERAAGKAKKRSTKAAKAVASAATSPFGRGTSEPAASEPATSDRSAPDTGAGGAAATVTPPLPPRPDSKPEPVNDLHELTRLQLLERARTAEIRGRSSMSKEQLVTALRRSS